MLSAEVVGVCSSRPFELIWLAGEVNELRVIVKYIFLSEA